MMDIWILIKRVMGAILLILAVAMFCMPATGLAKRSLKGASNEGTPAGRARTASSVPNAQYPSPSLYPSPELNNDPSNEEPQVDGPKDEEPKPEPTQPESDKPKPDNPQQNTTDGKDKDKNQNTGKDTDKDTGKNPDKDSAKDTNKDTASSSTNSNNTAASNGSTGSSTGTGSSGSSSSSSSGSSNSSSSSSSNSSSSSSSSSSNSSSSSSSNSSSSNSNSSSSSSSGNNSNNNNKTAATTVLSSVKDTRSNQRGSDVISYVAKGAKETPNYLMVKDSDGAKIRAKFDGIGSYLILPYDLSLVNGSGKPVAFESCTVTLPLDDSMNPDTGKVSVVSVREDDSLEKFDNAEVITVYSKNCVRFTTTHFSEYDVLYLSNAAPEAEATDPQNADTQSTDIQITASLVGGESPETSSPTGHMVSNGTMSGKLTARFYLDSPVKSSGVSANTDSAAGTPEEQAVQKEAFVPAAPADSGDTGRQAAYHSPAKPHRTPDKTPAIRRTAGNISDIPETGASRIGFRLIALVLLLLGLVLLMQTVPASVRTSKKIQIRTSQPPAP